MRNIKKCLALLLAVTLTLALAACGGTQSGKTNGALKARFSALYESDTLADMIADPAQYEDEIAAYGLDDFAGTFANADAFRTYTVEISLQNDNDFDVQVLNLQMDTQKQGENGVWFSALSETMPIGLPAKYTGNETLFYYAIADAKLSREDVLKTLGEMGISCVYMKGGEAPDMEETIDPSLLYTDSVLYED